VVAWRPEYAAGVLVCARSTGRCLFVRRSDTGEWATPGGHIERGETSREAAAREFREETGHGVVPRGPGRVVDGYRLFFAESPREFHPRLDHEHTAFRWAKLAEPPEPLHPGLRALFCSRVERGGTFCP